MPSPWRRRRIRPTCTASASRSNLQATDCQNTFNLMHYGFGGSMVAEDGMTIVVNSQETRDWLDYVVNHSTPRIVPAQRLRMGQFRATTRPTRDETVISAHNPASILVWLLDNKPEIAEVTSIHGLPGGDAGAFNSAGVRVSWAIMNTSAEQQQGLGADLLRYLMEPEQFEPWIALAFAAPAVAQYESMEMWQDPQARRLPGGIQVRRPCRLSRTGHAGGLRVGHIHAQHADGAARHHRRLQHR